MPEIKQEQPVGTLAELQKARLHPASYGSCSKPVKEGGKIVSLGCPYAMEDEDTGQPLCQLRPGTEVPPPWNKVFGAGPENVPTRTFMDGGKIIERQMACHEFMNLHQNWNEVQESGAAIEIIDGDTYQWRGTEPKATGASGKASFTHVDVVEERKVEKHPRPAENVRLLGDTYSALSMKKAAQRRRDRAVGRRLGKQEDEPEV